MGLREKHPVYNKPLRQALLKTGISESYEMYVSFMFQHTEYL
jgi:hypothetical protein